MDPRPASANPPAADAALLTLWEEARMRSPLARAALLADDEALDLPVGARDAAILERRRLLFGDRMIADFSCGACGEMLEVELSAATLIAASDQGGPTGRDLAEALLAADPQSARRLLAARIAGRNAEELDEAAVGAIETEVEAAGAPGDISLSYDCPACGGSGDAPLDPAMFLWREIDREANDLLDEVAILAAAFGWTEAETLALPRARRERYLERVR